MIGSNECDPLGIRFRRLGLAGTIAALCLSAATPSASAAVLILEKTGRPISEFALTGDGRAGWSQGAEFGTCETIVGGNLLARTRHPLTPCIKDVAANSLLPIGGHRVVASTAPKSGATRVMWSQSLAGINETDWSLRVTTSRGHHAVLGQWMVDCGIGNCLSGGNGLGPIAARDGVFVFGVITYTVPSGCGDMTCLQPSGGSIRRLIGGGHPPVKVPGAPPAALLTTGGGLFAEELYTPSGQPAPTIQVRHARTGNLVSTITVSGTIDTMAMSRHYVAVLTSRNSSNHLLRFNPVSGAPISSVPLNTSVDPASLGVFGKRVVYQTHTAIRVYRTDLGHSITIHQQRRARANLTIDEHGVRWLIQNTHGGTDVLGINLSPIP